MAIITDDRAASGYIFTFELLELEGTNLNGMENEITLVRWKLEGRIKDCPVCGMQHMGFFEGSTPLKSLTEQPKIPYEELTENDILSWVTEILYEDTRPFEVIDEMIRQKHTIGTGHNGGPMPKSWIGKL